MIEDDIVSAAPQCSLTATAATMAALNRPTEATYVTHEEVTVDTEDREDHTFCGIMFPVKCKALLPLDHVVIHSVAVRGGLGPLTVWVSKEEESPQQSQQQRGFRMNPRFWDKIYERTHGPSFQDYVELDLRANPIKLTPGQTRAIYIHSTLPNDEAIVYDNRHSRRTYSDSLVSILTGRAHVSPRAFGTSPIWGWGNPWRDHREFVGRLEYGAVYRLWNPSEFLSFGDKFQECARTLFLCQRRWESPLSSLPDECIFYILNMCRWDWFADTGTGMKAMRKKQKARAARIARLEQEQRVAEAAAVSAADGVARHEEGSSEEEEDEEGMGCCHRTRSQAAAAAAAQANADSSNEHEHEQFHAAREEEASDDEDDDFVEDIEEDSDEEFEEEDDDEDWDSDDGYGANHELFEPDDADSDDDEEEDTQSTLNQGHRAWIHRQFARIHVLQALAALDDAGVEDMED